MGSPVYEKNVKKQSVLKNKTKVGWCVSNRGSGTLPF